MAAVPPLTTHILDTAVGLPAPNVPIRLARQNQQGGFDELEQGYLVVFSSLLALMFWTTKWRKYIVMVKETLPA